MIEAKRCIDAGSQSRKEQATLSTLIGRTMGRTSQISEKHNHSTRDVGSERGA